MRLPFSRLIAPKLAARRNRVKRFPQRQDASRSRSNLGLPEASGKKSTTFNSTKAINALKNIAVTVASIATLNRFGIFIFLMIGDLAFAQPAQTIFDGAYWPRRIDADVFIDFEDSTDGTTLTTAILTNGTHGIQHGTWVAPTNSPNDFTISTAGERRLRTPIVQAGVLYNDFNSTRGVDFNHDNDTTEDFQFTFASDHDIVSFSFLIKVGLTASDFLNYDLFGLYNSTGSEFCVCQWIKGGGAPTIRAHSGAGAGANITVTSNVWYLITGKWTRNSTCQYAIYDAVTGLQVGATSSLALNNTAANHIRFGQNGHSGAPAVHSFFDDIAVDWTKATFPLGP